MGDAEYMKEYRASNPAYTERLKQQARARGKADRALRERHKIEWHALYTAYLSEGKK